MPAQSDPGPATVAAAVRLLGDVDHRVARRCLQSVVSWGEAARPALRLAARDDDARLRCRARRALRTLDLRCATAAFTRTLDLARQGREPRGVLAAGFDALQQLVVPQRPDAGRLGSRLDQLADELRPLVQGRTPATAARRLAEVLGGRHGLRGPGRERFACREELLPLRVLERGRGPSAVLAALYVMVGRRAGLDLSVVRLPRYFLVRLHGRRRVLIDPDHGGRTITRADCLRYLRELGDAGAGLHSLDDVPDDELLAGTLEDLLGLPEIACDPELTGALVGALEAVQQVRSRPPSALGGPQTRA